MILTNEQIEALKTCNSAEDVIAKANAAGYELSTEQAEKLLGNAIVELDEGDLDAINGGCGTQTSYKCWICDKNFDGEAPHNFVAYIGSDFNTHDACEECYQQHRAEYDWNF